MLPENKKNLLWNELTYLFERERIFGERRKIFLETTEGEQPPPKTDAESAAEEIRKIIKTKPEKEGEFKEKIKQIDNELDKIVKTDDKKLRDKLSEELIPAIKKWLKDSGFAKDLEKIESATIKDLQDVFKGFIGKKEKEDWWKNINFTDNTVGTFTFADPTTDYDFSMVYEGKEGEKKKEKERKGVEIPSGVIEHDGKFIVVGKGMKELLEGKGSFGEAGKAIGEAILLLRKLFGFGPKEWKPSKEKPTEPEGKPGKTPKERKVVSPVSSLYPSDQEVMKAMKKNPNEKMIVGKTILAIADSKGEVRVHRIPSGFHVEEVKTDDSGNLEIRFKLSDPKEEYSLKLNPLENGKLTYSDLKKTKGKSYYLPKPKKEGRSLRKILTRIVNRDKEHELSETKKPFTIGAGRINIQNFRVRDVDDYIAPVSIPPGFTVKGVEKEGIDYLQITYQGTTYKIRLNQRGNVWLSRKALKDPYSLSARYQKHLEKDQKKGAIILPTLESFFDFIEEEGKAKFGKDIQNYLSRLSNLPENKWVSLKEDFYKNKNLTREYKFLKKGDKLYMANFTKGRYFEFDFRSNERTQLTKKDLERLEIPEATLENLAPLNIKNKKDYYHDLFINAKREGKWIKLPENFIEKLEAIKDVDIRKEPDYRYFSQENFLYRLDTKTGKMEEFHTDTGKFATPPPQLYANVILGTSINFGLQSKSSLDLIKDTKIPPEKYELIKKMVDDKDFKEKTSARYVRERMIDVLTEIIKKGPYPTLKTKIDAFTFIPTTNKEKTSARFGERMIDGLTEIIKKSPDPTLKMIGGLTEIIKKIVSKKPSETKIDTFTPIPTTDYDSILKKIDEFKNTIKKGSYDSVFSKVIQKKIDRFRSVFAGMKKGGAYARIAKLGKHLDKMKPVISSTSETLHYALPPPEGILRTRGYSYLFYDGKNVHSIPQVPGITIKQMGNQVTLESTETRKTVPLEGIPQIKEGQIYIGEKKLEDILNPIKDKLKGVSEKAHKSIIDAELEEQRKKGLAVKVRERKAEKELSVTIGEYNYGMKIPLGITNTKIETKGEGGTISCNIPGLEKVPERKNNQVEMEFSLASGGVFILDKGYSSGPLHFPPGTNLRTTLVILRNYGFFLGHKGTKLPSPSEIKKRDDFYYEKTDELSNHLDRVLTSLDDELSEGTFNQIDKSTAKDNIKVLQWLNLYQETRQEYELSVSYTNSFKDKGGATIQGKINRIKIDTDDLLKQVEEKINKLEKNRVLDV